LGNEPELTSELADEDVVASRVAVSLSQSGTPGTNRMIRLTRLNKQPLALNSDLIKFIEYAPDAVITLVNGEKIVVLETWEQIVDQIVEFRRSVLRGLPLSFVPWTSADEQTSGNKQKDPPAEET
jgi:uncharacterized protein YlzI (FlbEa/FlbD family)